MLIELNIATTLRRLEEVSKYQDNLRRWYTHCGLEHKTRLYIILSYLIRINLQVAFYFHHSHHSYASHEKSRNDIATGSASG